MKTYNQDHDVVIEFDYHCIEKDKQDGELAEHKPHVKFVTFFMQDPERSSSKYIRVGLTPRMILAIAKQIEEIEKEIKVIPYDLIPF